MAVTAHPYGKFANQLATKKLDLSSDSIKTMIVTSSYTPNLGTHEKLADVTGETSGTGYTAGGKVLTGVALTYDPGTQTVALTANDAEWADSSITGRYAITYNNTATGKPLIAVADFGADIVSSAGPFKVKWADGVIIKLAPGS